MICFVSALRRCRAREFTGTMYAALFAVAALMPWDRALAQSSPPAPASSTTARRDSITRANRIARAKARRAAAAAKAKRRAGSTAPRVSGGGAGAAPAVSTRTAAAGSQGAAGSGNAATPSATPASPRPTPAPGTSATAAVAATGAGSPTGRTASGSASGPGSPGKTRTSRGDAAASKRKGGTAIADGGPALGFYGGASAAGFGFGIGPVLGAAWRFAAPLPSLRLRADVMGSHFSQTAAAPAGGAAITQSSSLTHVGGTLSAELSLSNRRTLRPYLLAGGGVFRFQASGPAGSNGTIANGVFKSTTDVAGIGGVGLQLNPRVYIEARYLTVGDFHTIPITAGVRF